MWLSYRKPNFVTMRNGCTSCTSACCKSQIRSKRLSKRRTSKSAIKTASSTLRDRFIKTNFDLFLLFSFFALYNSYNTTFVSSTQLFDDGESLTSTQAINEQDAHEESNDPVYAIPFPCFTQTIAVLIYYVLSRHLKILPYTAIVFLLGTVIGYWTNDTQENAVAYSTEIWLGINGQVILLVFLPGLIFNDSFTINVHLFFQAFWQLILFAFPMVLGGASLTALVAKYMLPYDWSPSLCMTFGAILSGTDPIAVAGLLKSAGAPQRLNMHISGESLLNDGSVVVLYNIFSAIFFNSLEIPEFGQEFTLSEGFAYFFRLSLGGCAIGLAFGVGTVMMLRFLNRRLSDEENVVQVVLLVSSAYVAYFTSEVLCLCSGIMATIACGITVKVLGETFINDLHLTLHFWQVTAELLNTLLFVLGGCLWGHLLSQYFVSVDDWGYLVALFLILIVIRFLLVFAFYPITARIGLGTNMKESVFMSYGGFRGSVGIALALSLKARVYNNTQDEVYRSQTDGVIFLVGGISIFTLLINGMTSGPLLSLLGLAAKEKTRRKVIANYKQRMIEHTLQEYVNLLSQERWKGIDHSIIKEHVPFLDDFTFDDLMIAVERHKNNSPLELYSKPRLEHIFPYLKGDQITNSTIRIRSRSNSFQQLFKSQSYEKLVSMERLSPTPAKRMIVTEHCVWKDVFDVQSESEGSNADSEDINELRLNYIEILRSSYYHQIEHGSLDAHDDLTYSLFQGLDFCEDNCSKGHPLNDWESTKVASDTRVVLANRMFLMFLRRCKQLWRKEKTLCSGLNLFDPTSFKIRFLVRQNLAFVRAHRHARRVFEGQFASNPMSQSEAQIVEESQAQIALAEADLEGIDQVDITGVKGHLMSLILLKKSVKYVEQLSRQHLIPEAAASDLLEVIDGYVENCWTCEKLVHTGRLNTSTQIARLKQLPLNIIDEFNIWEAIQEISPNSNAPMNAIAEMSSRDALSMYSPSQSRDAFEGMLGKSRDAFEGMIGSPRHSRHSSCDVIDKMPKSPRHFRVSSHGDTSTIFRQSTDALESVQIGNTQDVLVTPLTPLTESSNSIAPTLSIGNEGGEMQMLRTENCIYRTHSSDMNASESGDSNKLEEGAQGVNAKKQTVSISNDGSEMQMLQIDKCTYQTHNSNAKRLEADGTNSLEGKSQTSNDDGSSNNDVPLSF